MLPTIASLLLTAAPLLTATLAAVPPHFVAGKDKVGLTVTLTNATDRSITLLTGHAGSANYFFALQLEDRSGKVLWDGGAARFIDSDDLPGGTFSTLAPHGQYQAVLDWRYLYNLRPGSYKLSVVYRVEPDKEPRGAGLYVHEIHQHQAFIGRVQSPAVAITSRAP